MNTLPPLPEPSLLKLPDDGEGYSDEAPYIWAWFAHGYDTGMTPYFSDDQMNAFAQLAADQALEEAAKSDRADAERWRAAKELNAYALCNIAYQIKEACDFNTPDECMDAAIRAMKREP